MAVNNLASMNARETYRKRPADEMEKAVYYIDEARQLLSQESQVRLRSMRSAEATHVLFVNETATNVRALWLDFAGDEVAYSLIEGGASKRYRTFSTHPWIIRDVATGSRMMMNDRQVVYGTKEEQTVRIGHVPSLKWDLCTHQFFPSSFKAAARTLLLCHNQQQQQQQPLWPAAVCGTESKAEDEQHTSNSSRVLKWFLRSRCIRSSSSPAAATPANTESWEPCSSDNSTPELLAGGTQLSSLPKDLVIHILQLSAPTDVPQDLSLPEAAHPDIQPALLLEPPVLDSVPQPAPAQALP